MKLTIEEYDRLTPFEKLRVLLGDDPQGFTDRYNDWKPICTSENNCEDTQD